MRSGAIGCEQSRRCSLASPQLTSGMEMGRGGFLSPETWRWESVHGWQSGHLQAESEANLIHRGVLIERKDQDIMGEKSIRREYLKINHL